MQGIVLVLLLVARVDSLLAQKTGYLLSGIGTILPDCAALSRNVLFAIAN